MAELGLLPVSDSSSASAASARPMWPTMPISRSIVRASISIFLVRSRSPGASRVQHPRVAATHLRLRDAVGQGVRPAAGRWQSAPWPCLSRSVEHRSSRLEVIAHPPRRLPAALGGRRVVARGDVPPEVARRAKVVANAAAIHRIGRHWPLVPLLAAGRTSGQPHCPGYSGCGIPSDGRLPGA